MIALLRYLPRILGGIAVAVLLGMIVSGIHKNGRQVERVIWQKKDAQQAEANAGLLAKINAQRQQETKGLYEVINAQSKQNNALDRLNNDQRLYIAANKTRRDNLPKATSTSQPSATSDRIGLSEAFEREIRGDYMTAQRVVIQYEACRAALMNIAEIVE